MDCIAIHPQYLAIRRRRAGRAGRLGGGAHAEVRRGAGALGGQAGGRWESVRAGRCDTAEGPAATRRWGAKIWPHARGHVCGLDAACAHLGVLLGQQAVHWVHPTCFLTQYCF